MEQTSTQGNHQIIMHNRESLEISDVQDVDNFDDTLVVATTSSGNLTIRGDRLQVKRLDLECGLLTLSGKVDSLVYSEPTRGLFGRLLR